MTTPAWLRARGRGGWASPAARWRPGRSEVEDGSAAVEAAVLAPVMLVLLGLAIVGGRVQVAGGAIEAAAHDAARAASISRTAGQAQTAADAAAAATLDQQGLHCAQQSVVVDTAGFAVPVGQPATVSAAVSCVVDLSDLLAPGLPGTKTLSARFVSVLDTFRTRS